MIPGKQHEARGCPMRTLKIVLLFAVLALPVRTQADVLTIFSSPSDLTNNLYLTGEFKGPPAGKTLVKLIDVWTYNNVLFSRHEIQNVLPYAEHHNVSAYIRSDGSYEEVLWNRTFIIWKGTVRLPIADQYLGEWVQFIDTDGSVPTIEATVKISIFTNGPSPWAVTKLQDLLRTRTAFTATVMVTRPKLKIDQCADDYETLFCPIVEVNLLLKSINGIPIN